VTESRSAAAAGPRGRLYLVATPIGNLGDITLRALETLRAVSVIAAEDTRHTRQLLTHFEIPARLVSYHARNAASRGPDLIARLEAGEDVALVTDAGTPGVSDPGAELAADWGALGGLVVPIPGASAALAAIAGAGIAGARWSFEGFLPRSGRERRERIGRIADDERGSIVFEAPNRAAATLRDLAASCGGARPSVVCRELTKMHEEFVRGTLGELAEKAASGVILARGEVAIVIGEWRRADRPAVPLESPGDGGAPTDADPLASAQAQVEQLVAGGVARGDAARRVAAASGIPRRKLYGRPPGE
jgi:16S rRNA (cytidine1402-2'-O)-methyltransferase